MDPRATRQSWPAAVYRPGQEPPDDDLTATTTPEERLDMMWQLVEQSWAMAGRPIPDYERSSMPSSVIRPAG
jgi:hypothetical protein